MTWEKDTVGGKKSVAEYRGWVNGEPNSWEAKIRDYATGGHAWQEKKNGRKKTKP